jgi:HD-GYP domain-containing protein (c-di-GMP phosphodiesterase class II)
MIDNLHKWLILRLTIVWLILSVAIGGLIHYYGNKHLNDHIEKMAQAETAHYLDVLTSYLASPSETSQAELNRKIQIEIERDNMIVVELYDKNARKITEAVKPSSRAIEEQLPSHSGKFASREKIVIRKLTLENDLYMRVFVPIFNNAGNKIGYLEGIYHAPGEIISQIKQQTFWSLIMVVLIIFATTLVVYPLIIRLNRRLHIYSLSLALTNVGMLRILGSAIAKRDSDTNIHNYRVTLYSVNIAEKLGLSQSAMKGLIKGAFLHDLGKIAISDSILHKSGKLSDEEFEIMKTHVQHGEDIIRSYDWLKDSLDVVRCHHEKFDGSGYPSGLRMENIPVNARIFMIADVFDALTSKRPYKDSFDFDVTIGILRNLLGSHFDPAIAQLFLEHAETLYNEIFHDDEALLHGKLEIYITRYFQ